MRRVVTIAAIAMALSASFGPSSAWAKSKAPTVKSLQAQVAQLEKELGAANAEIAKLKGSAAPTTAPTTTAAPGNAHVGATIQVTMQSTGLNTAKANVTLVKVTDPAQGADDFTVPTTGDRFVAVEFQIAALGIISDDADAAASVIGSDNQSYTPTFASIEGCTDFNDGQIALTVGATSTGCVTFQVPTAVTVSKITFGHSFGTIPASWLVP